MKTLLTASVLLISLDTFQRASLSSVPVAGAILPHQLYSIILIFGCFCSDTNCCFSLLPLRVEWLIPCCLSDSN